MSVPASLQSGSLVPVRDASVPLEADSSLEARWAAWSRRGRQHVLVVKRKLRIALPGSTVIGLLVVLLVGLASGAR